MKSAGSRWPAILPGNRNSEVWSAYLELVRGERKNREFWVGQEEQLIDMLQHCSKNVPYYRERWNPGQAVGREALKHFPILSRRELAENLGQLIADKLPAGHSILGSRYTSGSTGTPVEVKTTNVTALWHLAMNLRILDWAETDTELPQAGIRFHEPHIAKELGNGLRMPVFEPAFGGFLRMAPGHIMDVHTDPALQMKWLREVRPDYLTSYPSNLIALVHQNQKDPLRLRGVTSMSEALSEQEEDAIVESFGCYVVNVYSSHEVGMIASPCRQLYPGRLHVYEENVLLEIVDDNGKACKTGEYGRVLLTTLHNYATPLIRYDIGDMAAWSASLNCGCGRPHRMIERPLGKRHPLFTLPNGTKKSSIGLAAAMRRLGGARQFRITQKTPTRVLVECLPMQSWNEQWKVSVEALMREFLESNEVSVLVATYADRLPLTMSGKSPHLVTEVA